MARLQVYFLPQLVAQAELAGTSCVVVDVLRATTTIVGALAAGARAVVPCLTVEDARTRAAEMSGESAILGGERGGVRIAGFALGNSPSEYTSKTVGGKTVILTTTNGTRALLHARLAAEILPAAFVNISAVCAAVATSQQVAVVCSGTDSEITREDVLLAGAIAERLSSAAAWELNDQAAIARDAWLQIGPDLAATDLQARILAAIRASLGGRNLIDLKMEGDLELASRIDRYSIAPRFHAKSGRIELLQADIAGPP